MKKRVKKSEIENNKGKLLIYIIIGILVVIAIISLGYIFLNSNVIHKTNKEENKIEDKTKVKEEYKDLEITNDIKALVKRVHKYGVEGDKTVFTNKKLSVDEMDSYYKFALASNTYADKIVLLDNVNEGGIEAEISEDVVRDEYNDLFGPDTYEALDTIPLYCGELEYDKVFKRYVSSGYGCGSGSAFENYENVLSARKSKTTLLITTAVVFVHYGTNSICLDYNCENVIDTFPPDSTDEVYFINYINNNKDKLYQYTYKFKIDKDHYYYLGFERTNG